MTQFDFLRVLNLGWYAHKVWHRETVNNEETKMKRGVLTVFALLLSTTVTASQPSFNCYQTDGSFKGGNHTLSEPASGNDMLDSMRAKIAKLPPNFAGHYTLYTFGCGGGARCGEIYDVITGKVITGLPNAYLDNDGFDLSFKKNSSLVIVSGVAADSEYDKDGKKMKPLNRDRYYNFKGERLVLVSEE